MGLVPHSYCEFTDSNWVWLRACLVLQFPDILKVGLAHKSTYPLHFILPTPSTTSYQQSLYSRSIKEWNELPVFIIEMTNYDEFTTNLISHLTNNQYHTS